MPISVRWKLALAGFSFRESALRSTNMRLEAGCWLEENSRAVEMSPVRRYRWVRASAKARLMHREGQQAVPMRCRNGHLARDLGSQFGDG